ncbi:alpha/beta hydrolase [Nocardioides salsibiostraticola]
MAEEEEVRAESTAGRLETDILGEPWVAETIALPDDDEGEVVATLVTHRCAQPTGRAVLLVHGFADYFFHTEFATWWVDRGYDFYAVDLRKYGRSIRPHQTPTYVSDLREYFPDLDAAWERIVERDGHDHVVLAGHSTGGLTAPLWANERQPVELSGVVLNSPWFDLPGSQWMRSAPAGAVLNRMGQRQPMREIPRDVNGFYGRSLHRDHEGEWDFDLQWKPLDSYPVRVGWLRAIRQGHAELHRGLEVSAPVLVLSSGATVRPSEMSEDVFSHDIVLDVAHIRTWATAVGPHVTYVAIPGALHDVVLSRPEPRRHAYAEIERWHSAYVD